jgi:hypothetical protein
MATTIDDLDFLLPVLLLWVILLCVRVGLWLGPILVRLVLGLVGTLHLPWQQPPRADLLAEWVHSVPALEPGAQEVGVCTPLPQGDEAFLSVSAAAAARLRPRARWVRVLDGLLGGRVGLVGRLIRGRWVPDLPAGDRSSVANALLANLKGGARLLGGGVVQRKPGEDGAGHMYFVLELPSGETVTVFPELLSRLQAYSCFRRRELALVPALRARGVDWCRSSGLPVWAWPLAVPSSVALSMQISHEEEVCWGLMPTTLLSEQLGF